MILDDLKSSKGKVKEVFKKKKLKDVLKSKSKIGNYVNFFQIYDK